MLDVSNPAPVRACLGIGTIAQHHSGHVFTDSSLLPFTVTEVRPEEAFRSWAAHEI